MNAISTGGPTPALRLHDHPLEHNMARAATAEAVGTFILVLAITSAAAAAWRWPCWPPVSAPSPALTSTPR